MLLGCIGDDFTGSSDLANTLARGGMRTMQFTGVPNSSAPPGCEAGVVALKSRSIPAADAIRQSLLALDWLRAQGARQILFKYCSTFDSTPDGNIGPVAEALIDRLGIKSAVACPAFPTTGRTIYQGHLFVGDRLLSESGMEKHPLTPMIDPDLRRWLCRQTKAAVGLVPLATVTRGPAAIRSALDACADRAERLVIVDALTNDDLLAIGEAIALDRLVTGASGIALGLPENFRKAGLLTGSEVTRRGVAGPAVVLAGSCSAATRAQVAAFAAIHPALIIVPNEAMDGRMDVEQALAFCRDHLANAPIVYSSAAPAEVATAQATWGRDVLAGTLERFFADLAVRLIDSGFSRLVVAGGETSGAVATALSCSALDIGPEIDPGVPALFASVDPPLGLALKSGNFGGIDFFDKALRILGGKTQ